jgi:hypothetical protein
LTIGVVRARGQRLHASNLALDPIGALAIAFIDHEDIGDFHDPGLDRLHIIAHAGHKNYDGDIRQPYNVDFVLPDANRFDHDQVAARGIEHRGSIRGGARQPSK